MEEVLEHFWNSIDVVYVLMCNLITYLIITCFPNGKEMSTGAKRVISTIVAIGTGHVFVTQLGHPREMIFYGFFVQFLMYDYILKWFFRKIGEEPKQTKKSSKKKKTTKKAVKKTTKPKTQNKDE